MRASWLPWICAVLSLVPRQALGQKSWEYGGFLQGSAQVYARKPNPPDAYAGGTAHFQLWSRAVINSRLSWRGTFDLRLDSHRDVDRRQWVDLTQRGLRQPAGAVSEFYLDMKLNHVDLRLGKQQIRWGRADGFNPTDNLIPYDYLDTFSDERLAVPALKADAYVASAHFEAAWVPFYTPTRLPLLGQRWFPHLPSTLPLPLAPGAAPADVQLTYIDRGGRYPARTFGDAQWGVRYNQNVPRAEFSLSYFDGFDDIPFFRADVTPLSSTSGPLGAQVSLSREYYRVRVVGADFASEFGPFGIRGETAYFDQTDPNNLDHMLFVIGLDKTWGDWFAIVQYAGQKINGRVQNAAIFPDLGLRSTMIFRVERTLGPSRSLEIKGALRLLDGDFFVQPLYSIALSNNWRLKLGASIFAGAKDSYLGQFRDNSRLNLQLIYTF